MAFNAKCIGVTVVLIVAQFAAAQVRVGETEQGSSRSRVSEGLIFAIGCLLQEVFGKIHATDAIWSGNRRVSINNDLCRVGRDLYLLTLPRPLIVTRCLLTIFLPGRNSWSFATYA